MKWILIGTLLGSLVTSQHDSEEGCRGRAAVLKKKDIITECYPAPAPFSVNDGFILKYGN